MKLPFIRVVAHFLLRYLHIQLFITTVSLPILLYWGLPFSLLSPIGNLLFFPFLYVTLLLATVVFFCKLLCIPHGLFVWGLDRVTIWWLQLLEYGGSDCLVTLPTPPIWFLLFFVTALLVIIHYRPIATQGKQIICFVLLLVCTTLYLRVAYRHKTCIEQFPCHNGKIMIIATAGKVAVIDPGYMGQRVSACSWVEYTLAPHLATTLGTHTIDHLVVMQPGLITCRALTILCSVCRVKNLYFVYWNGTLSKKEWSAYFTLLDACKKQGTLLKRLIAGRDTAISLGIESYLHITPLDDTLTTGSYTYPPLYLEGLIDNMPLTLYSAKYKKKLVLS